MRGLLTFTTPFITLQSHYSLLRFHKMSKKRSPKQTTDYHPRTRKYLCLSTHALPYHLLLFTWVRREHHVFYVFCCRLCIPWLRTCTYIKSTRLREQKVYMLILAQKCNMRKKAAQIECGVTYMATPWIQKCKKDLISASQPAMDLNVSWFALRQLLTRNLY